MSSKCIGKLIIVEINRELHKRGIETGESEVDRLIILKEFIRTKERTDPETLWFGRLHLRSCQSRYWKKKHWRPRKLIIIRKVIINFKNFRIINKLIS